MEMNRIASALCVAIVFGLPVAMTAEAMKLVSIQGLNIGKNEYVAAFEIDTWAIQIRAVCHLPVGWMITAGRELNPGGHISGKASGFMTNLNYKQVGELKDLILIDDPMPDRYPSPSEPPMFVGSITVGSYDTTASAGDRVIPLKVGSIVLRDARQCAAPISN
jgi:hypothetical protein